MKGCTLFGKLPWAADYVRVNHVHRASLALDAWLQASHQQLALAGAGWPAVPLRFLFSVREADAVLAGVLAPSRDRAGRSFPVALFAALPGALRFARVPSALAPFYDQAERVLAEVAQADRARSEHVVAALRAPTLADLDVPVHDALTASALASALFEASPEQSLLRVGAALARATLDAGTRAPVLALPCGEAAHLAAWLIVVESLRDRASAPPSLFWSSAHEARRAWVSLAAPPAMLLPWIVNPARRGERLRVLVEAPAGADATRLAVDLSPASFSQPVDAFFRQLAAAFLRSLHP